MIDPDYLKKLKEEDYIAWDDMVNDPMVTGSSDGEPGCVFAVVIMLILAFLVIMSFC